jgi:hypothetical protein
MKYSLILLFLISLFLISFSFADNYALCIGIEKYPTLSPRSQLKFCEKDAEEVAKLLQEKYQFSANNIEILTSEKATYNGIFAAFKRLIDKTKAGDEIVVYYSGHGTQQNDDNNDEADGKDEAIVTSDGKLILDDTLAKWTKRITEKTDRLFVVFDCCHSGNGMKSAGITEQEQNYFLSKYVDPSEIPDTKDLGPVIPEDHVVVATTNQNGPVVRDRENQLDQTQIPFIFLSASSEFQVSYVVPRLEHSAFTYFLLHGLQENCPADLNQDGMVAFEEMRNYAQNQIRQETSLIQTPQLEGPYQRVQGLFPRIFTNERGRKPHSNETAFEPRQFLLNLVHLDRNRTPYTPWNISLELVSPTRTPAKKGQTTTYSPSIPEKEVVQYRIKTNVTGYLVVLNIGPTGNINLLFPNKFTQKTVSISAGQVIDIPDKSAGFNIQVAPPNGKEYIIAYLLEWDPLQGKSWKSAFGDRIFLKEGLTDLAEKGINEDPYEIQEVFTKDHSIIPVNTPEIPNLPDIRGYRWNKAIIEYQTSK